MVLCSECKFSKIEYGGQECCRNNLSDFYGEIMDKGEGCNYGKRKKIDKIKNIDNKFADKNKVVAKNTIAEYKQGKVATNGEGKIGLYIAFYDNTIFQQNGKAMVFTSGTKAKNWLNKVNQLGIGKYEIRKVII